MGRPRKPPQTSEDKVNSIFVEEINSMFSDKEDRKKASTIARRYLAEYDIETPADKTLLKQLVNLEVVQSRFQEALNTSSDTGLSEAKLVDVVHKNLANMMKVIQDLGLSKSARDATKTDGYLAYEDLIKKAQRWGEKNQLSRTSKCPHCQKFILWKRRTENWELLKHPYLQDNLLINEELLDLVGKGIITPLNYVRAMKTSPNSEDFFYWLVSKLSNEMREKYNLHRFMLKSSA